MAPTIVLIPGCWHQASTFDAVRSHLELTHPTVSKTLPSCYEGPTAPTPPATQATDATFIRNELLLPLIDEGKELVLVCHSYGGTPGGSAVRSLSKEVRAARGDSGGVLGLVFIAALIPSEGQSSGQLFGEHAAPELADPTRSYFGIAEDLTHTFARTETAQQSFYHDVPDAEAKQAVSQLRKHAIGGSLEPTTYVAWQHPEEWADRCVYVMTTADRVIPVELQKEFVKTASMRVKTIEGAGHSPFLSRVDETAEVIRSCIADFKKLV